MYSYCSRSGASHCWKLKSKNKNKGYQMKFYANSPIFCYLSSSTHHFLSYFLSSALLKKEKKKKPLGFSPPLPSLRIPVHSPDAYNGVSGTCSPRKF